MQNIAIFCGSKNGENPRFLEETIQLGKIIALHKKHIVYGGGNVGLMGAVANAAIANGGTVTGIIPNFLHSIEREHKNLNELIVTETMHERKVLLFGKCDTAIILPGGFGTLDELFELLTWNQLELHKIKVFILNIDGFYDSIKVHIQKMLEQNFLYIEPDEHIVYLDKADDLQQYF